MCSLKDKTYKFDSNDKNLTIRKAACIDDRKYTAFLRLSISMEDAEKARELFSISDYEKETDFERAVYSTGLEHIKENNKHFHE